jgi:hypothetical protein
VLAFAVIGRSVHDDGVDLLAGQREPDVQVEETVAHPAPSMEVNELIALDDPQHCSVRICEFHHLAGLKVERSFLRDTTESGRAEFFLVTKQLRFAVEFTGDRLIALLVLLVLRINQCGESAIQANTNIRDEAKRYLPTVIERKLEVGK